MDLLVSHFAHRAHGIMSDQLSLCFASMCPAYRATRLHVSKAAGDVEKQRLSNSYNNEREVSVSQQPNTSIVHLCFVPL